MKIYTRKGDKGETSLFGGRRVSKDDIRVEAYGAVDELNSALGLAVARLPEALGEWRERLVSIQSDCFTLGAILATPQKGAAKPEHIPELAESRVETLEDWIDELDEELEPLKAFVLPGGSEAAAVLHLASRSCSSTSIGCPISCSHSPGRRTPVPANRTWNGTQEPTHDRPT